MRDFDNDLRDTAEVWRLKSCTLRFGRLPALMGILNVTPDSFSDGGRFLDPRAAIDQACAMIEQGASIIDIGGESTRPYSEPVSEMEELRRTVDVVQAVAECSPLPVSIDTSKAKVAEECLQAGAEIINDVTGLEGDPRMIEVALESGAGVCVMHMQGTPQTMQNDPRYENVVEDILEYLRQRQEFLLRQGIAADRICLDPGIGFGKTHQHNLELVAGCHRFHELKAPLLVGHSRKGFIAKVLGDGEADRDAGTAGVAVELARQGVQVIRVHDVKSVEDTLLLFDAVGGIDGRLFRVP